MRSTAPRAVTPACNAQFSFKSLWVSLAAAPVLWLTGCAASGGGGANVNSPEFQAAASQIVSRISNSGATLEFVSASNSGGLKVSKSGTARKYFTKVGIRSGVLALTETDQTNVRSAFPTFVFNESKTTTFVYRIPLAEVNSISITDVELDAANSPDIEVNQYGGGNKSASLRTKTRYQVNVGTNGELISQTYTYVSSDSQGSSYSSKERSKTFAATVAAFDTKEQARVFAREFQSMVAKLTSGAPPKIDG